MKFPRSKTLVFCNNKGWVGKTTLAYNAAAELAQTWLKVMLVDLDPQCNLTTQTLGLDFYENRLFREKTIGDVLSGIINGGGDIDMTVQWVPTSVDNLFIIPGDLKLSLYDSLLADSAFNAAGAWKQIGYFQTSAITRFLTSVGIRDDIDIFVLDTSPSLSPLNQAILLGSDYFIVPLMADSFSIQGIENLGGQLTSWKERWKISALALSRVPNMMISSEFILKWDPLFVGYIINNFNVYSKKTIQRQDDWRRKMPDQIKKHLSLPHSRNWLIEISAKNPLAELQDYGQLTPISMEHCKPIARLSPSDDTKLNIKWTKELLEKAKREIQSMGASIMEIVGKY